MIDRHAGTVAARWTWLALLASCATARPVESPAAFVRAYGEAMEAHEVELPDHVRTAGDIQLVAKAHDVTATCALGSSKRFPSEWFNKNLATPVTVDSEPRTVGALGKACADMLEALDHRSVKACGARYVRLERGHDGKERVVQTSEGWYMTPCDQARTAKRAPKETELARDACHSPVASVYFVSKWATNGSVETATAVCLLPDAARTDWLPGNPGLGIK